MARRAGTNPGTGAILLGTVPCLPGSRPMPKLQRNLLLIFTAAALISIILAVMITVNLRIERDYRALAKESAGRLQTITSLTTALYRAESSHRAFAASGSSLFEGELDILHQLLDEHLVNLENLDFASDDDAALGRDLSSQVLRRKEQMNSLAAARRDQGAEIAAQIIGEGSGKQLTDAVKATVDALHASESARLHQQEEISTLHAQRLGYLLGTGILLNLLLLGGAFAVARRELKRNAQLVMQLRRHTHEVTIINQLTSSLQSCQTREETAEVLRHFLALLFPRASGGLYLMHASRNLLSLMVSWGEGESEPALVDPIKPQDCWSLRLGRPHTQGTALSGMPCDHLEAGVANSLCVPLIAQSDIVAMLHIRIADADQLPDAQRLAELLATHTASALAGIILREALHRQSVRDPLTGLFNRRYLEESVEREILRARRSGNSLGFVMLDIDHFKRFNDEYGHQAGDLLLKEFAGFVLQSLRGEDIGCRYGGEEFLLLLPGADVEQAAQKAEQIRGSLSRLVLDFQGRRLPSVTASFGVSAYPDQGDDWETIIGLADGALYQAKADGRNRVVTAGGRRDVAHKA